MPHSFSLRLVIAALLATCALGPAVALADDLPVDPPAVFTGDPGPEDPGVSDDWELTDDELVEEEEYADDIPPLALVQAGKRFGIALGFDADDETLVPQIVLLREVGKGRCIVASARKPPRKAPRGKPCTSLAARTPATVTRGWDVEVEGLPTVLLASARKGTYRVFVTAEDVDGSQYTLEERFVVTR